MRALLLSLLTVFFSFTLVAGNSLYSLVFDFSSDLKTTLPADGWAKMAFSMVNYGDKELHLKFSAICVESGKTLAFYPQEENFSLQPGEERAMTLFMNEECAGLENADGGQHSRMVRFLFTETQTHETLTFEQMYIIEVPKEASIKN